MYMTTGLNFLHCTQRFTVSALNVVWFPVACLKKMFGWQIFEKIKFIKKKILIVLSNCLEFCEDILIQISYPYKLLKQR